MKKLLLFLFCLLMCGSVDCMAQKTRRTTTPQRRTTTSVHRNGAQSKVSSSSKSINLSLLTSGKWYIRYAEEGISMTYTYKADGTGKLTISTYLGNIDGTFRWSISNNELCVVLNSDISSLSSVKGWSGEIRVLNDEKLELFDPQSYERETYTHLH